MGIWSGGKENVPCTCDMKIAAPIPNVLEKWSMTIKADKETHRFVGITFFGLRIAIKAAVKGEKGGCVNYGVDEMSTDGENIAHLMSCPGCPECDRLLEFYTCCDECGYWGHKEVMHYDEVTGKSYCSCHD